jgi:hypothetical protein
MDFAMMSRRVGEIAVFAALAVVGVFTLDIVIARTAQAGSTAQWILLVSLTGLATAAMILAIAVGLRVARGGLHPSPAQLLPPRLQTVAGGIMVADVIALLLVHGASTGALLYVSGSAVNAFYLAWLRADELRRWDA